MTVLLPLLLLVSVPAADTVDLLVRGGTVHDGRGGAPRQVDLGIRGQRIVFLGDAAQAGIVAGRTIKAAGLIVAPGFIDPMERMIQSSSGQVAEVYGIPDRGTLEVGRFADLIVFDPKTIREEATYLEPEKLSTGMRWVFVNGQAAVADGTPTGALAGKGLRKGVKQ